MIRNLTEYDYQLIITKIDSWWGGRDMVNMLPFLFFKHFSDTSFVYEQNGRVVGFVVGFISAKMPEFAYIHFTGVDPEFRHKTIASRLYSAFIEKVKPEGCKAIQCVTSPANNASLAYHHRIGFRATGYYADGSPEYIKDYDGPGNDRVLLTLEIGKQSACF